MKKYLNGEFSTEKLRKAESAINRYYSRARLNRLIVFIITCFHCLVQGIGYSLSMRYVGDFNTAFSFDKFIILKDLQSILDKWFFKDYGILDLAFPILIMIAVSIISYLSAVALSVILHLIKNLLFTGLLVIRISDKNPPEKIKKLIKRTEKIRKVGDPDVPFPVVVILSYLIAVTYPVYTGLEYLDEITSENILPLLLLAGALIVVMTLFGTIPLLLSFYGVTLVNSSFYYKISGKISPIETKLDNWWVETDPQEKRRREQKAEESRSSKKYSDSYLSTMARAYVREQSGSSSSSSDHGPYATATNCGMPDIFGMPPGLDVRDM